MWSKVNIPFWYFVWFLWIMSIFPIILPIGEVADYHFTFAPGEFLEIVILSRPHIGRYF